MEPETDELTASRPGTALAFSSLLKTLLSFALLIAVDYFFFKSWSAVFILVSVLLIHESGHFAAMKYFGYRAVRMTFVPFMGAFVSGESSHFSKFKRIIVLLAGPLPGILLGMILLLLYQYNHNQQYYLAAMAFLALNLFNLLPVSPLDGGQLFETLFIRDNLLIQLLFVVASILVLGYFALVFKVWVLVVVMVLAIIRVRRLYLCYKVRRVLDKMGIGYEGSYEDLTDEQYAAIRDILVTESRVLRNKFTPGEYSAAESSLISYLKIILVPEYDQDLTPFQKTGFILLLILLLVVPLLQWLLTRPVVT